MPSWLNYHCYDSLPFKESSVFLLRILFTRTFWKHCLLALPEEEIWVSLFIFNLKLRVWKHFKTFTLLSCLSERDLHPNRQVRVYMSLLPRHWNRDHIIFWFFFADLTLGNQLGDFSYPLHRSPQPGLIGSQSVSLRTEKGLTLHCPSETKPNRFRMCESSPGLHWPAWHLAGLWRLSHQHRLLALRTARGSVALSPRSLGDSRGWPGLRSRQQYTPGPHPPWPFSPKEPLSNI